MKTYIFEVFFIFLSIFRLFSYKKIDAFSTFFPMCIFVPFTNVLSSLRLNKEAAIHKRLGNANAFQAIETVVRIDLCMVEWSFYVYHHQPRHGM